VNRTLVGLLAAPAAPMSGLVSLAHGLLLLLMLLNGVLAAGLTAVFALPLEKKSFSGHFGRFGHYGQFGQFERFGR
jgi:hypothetical protein